MSVRTNFANLAEFKRVPVNEKCELIEDIAIILMFVGNT